jgi:CheY-specific phosphatase CheX
MQPEHRAALGEVAAEVCQKQAFLFAEECDPAEALTAAGPFLQATISFAGPRRGVLGIAATRSLTLELAANLLDLDPESEETAPAAADALGELANVVCGQFLTSAYGSTAVFRLSIPAIGDLDDEAWAGLANSDESLCLSFEESHAVVHLSLEADRPCPSAS